MRPSENNKLWAKQQSSEDSCGEGAFRGWVAAGDFEASTRDHIGSSSKDSTLQVIVFGVSECLEQTVSIPDDSVIHHILNSQVRAGLEWAV